MNRRFLIVTMLAAIAVTAGGDWLRAEPFPLKQVYVATALNGRPFDDRSRTLWLWHDHRGHVIGAYAGCNQFSAEVTFFNEGHYTIRGAFQTAAGCGAKNDAEKMYFDTLLRTKQWRISEGRLILQGDKDVLQFETAKKEAMQ